MVSGGRSSAVPVCCHKLAYLRLPERLICRGVCVSVGHDEEGMGRGAERCFIIVCVCRESE